MKRILVFLLAFTLDVKVKAEVTEKAQDVGLPATHDPLQEPADCARRSGVCAMKTSERQKFTLKTTAADVVLDAGTVVIRQSETNLTLVKGTVWVKAKSQFSVITEFGMASGELGDFWVARTKERMVITAIGATVVLSPRGSQQDIRLDQKEENWLGPVAKNGQATSGVPEAISLPAHMARWARLYPGKKSGFEKEVKAFIQSWQRSIASLADYQQSLAEQNRRALEAKAALQAQNAARGAEEDRRRRALFRSKTLLD